MSSSSDSEFDGFSQEFSVVDTVVDGSGISISDVVASATHTRTCVCATS